MTALPETWLEKLRGGHRLTLARAITAVENETADAGLVLKGIHPHLGHALVVGFTGPPGAGKSTLVSAYVAELRRRGLTVAVVAVDPSSPLSGGAILGDRIRMGEHAEDAGVFVRSLASRGALGGLSATAARVIDVFDAAGRDVVVVETVGTGQSEVEIHEIAQTRVVVVPPGLGDDIQAIKAGILEIADILAVTKCDLPLAERTVAQLGHMTRLVAGEMVPVPVLRLAALEGQGVAELADAIAAHAARSPRGAALGRLRMRRLLAHLAASRAKRLLEGEGDWAALDALCDSVQDGALDLESAAIRALELAAAPLTPGGGG